MSQEVVRSFHELYYDAAQRGGTWKNTHWMGVPIAKCPLDLWVYQEILFEVRPEVIIECGTFAGGSALFLAQLCDLLDRGHILTIDVADHAIPRHPRISRIIGSSTAPQVVEQARRLAAGRSPILVILDSDHHAHHVLEEMRHYGPLVSPGSYLIVEDTNINGHPALPGFGPGPMEAVRTFLGESADFVPDLSREKFLLTFNPTGYLRKRGRPGGSAPDVGALTCAPDALAPEAMAELARLRQAGTQVAPRAPADAAAQERHPLRLRDRVLEVPFATRGRVDREILAEVWEGDVYGVRDVAAPPATVLDIGAHTGAFAVLAARTWSQARVIACECDPDNFLLLRRNVAGCPNVELVEAAVLADDVPRVEFHTVLDKAGRNSGGGSCLHGDAESVTIWVRAVSVARLWEERQIGVCDFLKLDCEGAEIPILAALARAGLLARVRQVVGEWHAFPERGLVAAGVRAELTRFLEPTHEVTFISRLGDVLGYFRARARNAP